MGMVALKKSISRTVALLSITVVAFAALPLANATVVKISGVCKSQGAKAKASGKAVVCTKVGTKLIWQTKNQRLAAIAKAKMIAEAKARMAAANAAVAAAKAKEKAAADAAALPALQAAQLLAAARKEGKVVFYSVETVEMNTALTTAFTAKYGIPVETLRLITGPMLERFAGEQRAGVTNADMIQVVDEAVWKTNANWFVNFDKTPVQGWAAYPAAAKHSTCADMMYSIGGITYNKNLVDAAHIPTTYRDMLKPYWKGKLLLTDPRTSPAYMGWAAAIEKKYGIEFLTKLRAQNPVLVASASPGAQQVAAGAYYANMMAHLSNSTALRTAGAPLGFVVMKDVPTGLPTCAGIPANAPHPNAARLFMTWRMTVEAQNAGCAVVEVGSALKGATKCVKLPTLWKSTDLQIMSDKAHQDRILSALGIQ